MAGAGVVIWLIIWFVILLLAGQYAWWLTGQRDRLLVGIGLFVAVIVSGIYWCIVGLDWLLRILNRGY